MATEAEQASTVEQATRSGTLEGLASMPGSYAVVVESEQAVHIVADQAGQHPVYYNASQSSVQFSTSAQEIARSNDPLRPDTTVLAAQIAMPGSAALTMGRTSLRGVFQAMPGHILHADRQGAVQTHQHNLLVPDSILTFDEAAEQLRAALVDGARRRLALGKAMSADFSGGLDSTSAAYITAAQMQEPLLVATRTTPELPLDDIRYVEHYLSLPESEGQFTHHIIEQSAATIMHHDLLGVDAGDLPGGVRARTSSDAYYAAIAKLGGEMHLTGIGADSLFDMSPLAYMDDIRRAGHPLRYVRAIADAARMNYSTVRATVAEARLAATYDSAQQLAQAAHILATPGTYPAATITQLFGAGAAPWWLTRHARREVAELALEQAALIGERQGMDRANYRAYNDLLALGSATRSEALVAAKHGVRLQSPYHDNDVLKACLALPAHKRMDPRLFKPLLRRATQGIVPDAVTSRVTKGDYTKHVYRGLRASEADIRQLLSDSYLADLGIINPKTVQQAFDLALQGADIPFGAFDALLASELWLRSLDGNTGTRSVDSPPPHTMPAKKAGQSQSKTSQPEEPIAYSPKLSGGESFGMAPHVIVAKRSVAGLLMDMRTMQYELLNTHNVQMLEALREGGSVDGAVAHLRTVYPTADLAQLRQAAHRGIADMVAAGILTPDSNAYTILDGSLLDTAPPLPATMVRETEQTPHIRLGDYAAVVGGFALRQILRRKHPSFDEHLQAVVRFRDKRARSPALPEQSERLLVAAKRLSAGHAGRIACLELTIVTTLANALQGKRSEIVFGAKADPNRFHAWPQAQGVPVRTSVDPPIAGMFQPLVEL